MKRFLFSLLACLLLGMLPTSATHAQGTEWAKWISDNTTGGLNALCHDSSDNVYVTGRVGPNGQVDGNPIGVQGAYDMFLVKFNASGEFQWSQRGGGNDPFNMNEGDSGADVVYDPNSNAVYVCGRYEGSPATFGGGVSFSGKGAFLAKYSTAGECLWVRRTDHGAAGSVHVNAAGNVLITGGGVVGTGFPPMPDSITFFGDPNTRIETGPFIAKYSTTGDLIWAKKVADDIGIRGLSFSDNRSIIFGTKSVFGSNPELLEVQIPLNTASYVGFIAEVDSAFSQIIWLHYFNSPTLTFMNAHSFIDSGDHLIGGGFMDSLYLSTDTLVGPSGEYRPFVLRLDSAGTVEHWVIDLRTDIGASRSPRFSVYQDGTFSFAIPFVDSVHVDGQTFIANSSRDFVVARINTDGSLISAMHQGPVTTGGMDVTVLSDGGAVLGSTFSGTIDLGNDHVLGGGADIFVAKLGIITSVPTLKTSASGELLIYANPNNGTCTIDVPEALLYETDLVLRILDAQGRLVQQSALRMHEDRVQLDIRAQAKGTYVAEVSNGKVRYTGRIVFE